MRKWSSLVLLLPLFACGCLGVETALPREEAMSVGELCPCAGQPLTAEALTHQWGRPYRIDTDRSDELWHYRRGDTRWVGVTLYLLVLPIPLRVPAGSTDVTVRFHDGEFVSASRSRVAEHTYMCMFVYGPCTSPGCESY
jgi:hypothetical protein